MSDNPFRSAPAFSCLIAAVVLTVVTMAARRVVHPRLPQRSTGESARSEPGVIKLPSTSILPEGQRVYACSRGGTMTYADRPCDDRASVRVLDATKLNVYDGAAATPPDFPVAPSPPRPAAVTVAGVPPPAMVEKATRCVSLQEEIDRIDARMRQGYSSAEGEQLRATRHRLTDERYAVRCGR